MKVVIAVESNCDRNEYLLYLPIKENLAEMEAKLSMSKEALNEAFECDFRSLLQESTKPAVNAILPEERKETSNKEPKENRNDSLEEIDQISKNRQYELARNAESKKQEEVDRLKRAAQITGDPKIKQNYEYQRSELNKLGVKHSNAFRAKVIANNPQNESFNLALKESNIPHPGALSKTNRENDSLQRIETRSDEKEADAEIRIDNLKKQRDQLDDRINKAENDAEQTRENYRDAANNSVIKNTIERTALRESKILSTKDLAFTGESGVLMDIVMNGTQYLDKPELMAVAERIQNSAVFRNLKYKYTKELSKVNPDREVLKKLKNSIRSEIIKYKKNF